LVVRLAEIGGAMPVSHANWTNPGATLSHKNACKEFGIEESIIIEAIRQGKLQYKENYAHGNPYFRLLRDEVENFAKEIHGEETMKMKKIEYEIKKTKTEINSYKRKIVALERHMQNLTQRKNEMEN
jgi:septal ring factor EnvC (AmiA/AmiB activator)